MEPKIPDSARLSEHTNKLTFAFYRKEFKLKTEADIGLAESSLHLLRKNAASYQFSMLFERPSKFTDIFIRNINELIDTGVIEKLEKKRNFADGPPKQNKHQIARVLNMDHLGVCFIFILIALSLCVLVFVIECIVGYSRP